MLISLALISGTMLLMPVLRGAAASGLNPTAAVQLMNREKAVVVDVCEPNEFAAGHIVGSKNIPLNQLESKLTGAVKNKSLPLILVCQSGMRSNRAVAIAKKLGYEQAQSLGVACLPGRVPIFLSKRHDMQAVKMYTTAVCPYCVQAKRILKSKGVEVIEEVRVDSQPEERLKMMELTGRRTVPQIFIGDTHVGGCDDLIALDSRGGLMPLLSAA